MERLTERERNYDGSAVFKEDIARSECILTDFGSDALTKLADYEDLEEEGKMVKLQCKIGDTIWDNDYGSPCAYTIKAISLGMCGDYVEDPISDSEVMYYFSNLSGSITGSFPDYAIGKSVFLTREEAERNL